MRAHTAKAAFTRVLALVTLISATPGIAQVVREFGNFAFGQETCAECADEGAEQNCAESCVCCAHSNVLPTLALVEGPVPLNRECRINDRGERPYSAGYRSPPFRPPAG